MSAGLFVYIIVLFTGFTAGVLVGKKPLKKSLSLPKTNFPFVLRITVVVLLLILLGIVDFYVQKDQPKMKLADRIKIITGGLVIIGLLYSVLSFEANLRKTKNDIRVAKASATYAAVAEWHRSPLVDYSKSCYEFEQTDLFKVLKSNTNRFFEEFDKPELIETRKALVSVLNYFEAICSAVTENIMDERFAEKYFKTIFEAYYTAYEVFINERRTRRNRPTVWKEFTTLVLKWRES